MGYPLSTMFRIDCMQHWYSMSDPTMEDALHEVTSMRLFALANVSRVDQRIRAARG